MKRGNETDVFENVLHFAKVIKFFFAPTRRHIPIAVVGEAELTYHSPVNPEKHRALRRFTATFAWFSFLSTFESPPLQALCTTHPWFGLTL
jgi:hypothetical protein